MTPFSWCVSVHSLDPSFTVLFFVMLALVVRLGSHRLGNYIAGQSCFVGSVGQLWAVVSRQCCFLRYQHFRSRCDTIFIMIFHTVAFLHCQGRNSNFVYVANSVMRRPFTCFHDTSQMGIGRQSRTATQAWQTIAGEQLCFVSFVGTL